MALSPGVIATDNSGNPIAATPAAALASNQSAFVCVGSDYGTAPKAQAPKVDANGQQYVVPSTPGGASAYVYNGQTPPAASAQYGLTINALQPLPTPVYLPVTLDPTASVNTHLKSKPTFRFILPTTAGGASKSMMSIMNGSTNLVVRIQQCNVQTPYTYTTGNTLIGLTQQANRSVVMLHEMRRITGQTKAATTTVITAALADSNDPLDSTIVAMSNATLTGSAAVPFHRADANSPSGLPWYVRGDVNQKTLVLRPGEGMSVTSVSDTTNYNFDIELVVTVLTA